MEGQVSVFQSSVTGYLGTPCYRCIFPEAPNIDQAPGCSEAGILGPVTGVVGSLQALETIKLITGISKLSQDDFANRCQQHFSETAPTDRLQMLRQ